MLARFLRPIAAVVVALVTAASLQAVVACGGLGAKSASSVTATQAPQGKCKAFGKGSGTARVTAVLSISEPEAAVPQLAVTVSEPRLSGAKGSLILNGVTVGFDEPSVAPPTAIRGVLSSQIQGTVTYLPLTSGGTNAWRPPDRMTPLTLGATAKIDRTSGMHEDVVIKCEGVFFKLRDFFRKTLDCLKPSDGLKLNGVEILFALAGDAWFYTVVHASPVDPRTTPTVAYEKEYGSVTRGVIALNQRSDPQEYGAQVRIRSGRTKGLCWTNWFGRDLAPPGPPRA